MYETFYQLRAEPFRLSPDHRFCFSHRSYAKAKAYMQYALHRAEGFVMITGRPGTGKTTLVNDLLDGLSRSKVTVAMLVTTQLEANDLLRMVAYSFGLDAEAPHKSTILQNLTMMLTRHHRERKRALLIIDEAQDLSSSALEELRLLTNLQLNSQPLLQIFLLGQEALRDLVQEPGMEQVHQRLVAACHLEPLKEDETRSYIKHRLERVGWKGDPAISEEAFPLIYKFSHGIPRRINLVCSRLFLHGSVEERHEIGVEDARIVLEELKHEQLMPLSIQEDPEFSMPELEELTADDFNAAGGSSGATPTEEASTTAAEPPVGVDHGPVTSPLEEAVSAAAIASLHDETEPARLLDVASEHESTLDSVAKPAHRDAQPQAPSTPPTCPAPAAALAEPAAAEEVDQPPPHQQATSQQEATPDQSDTAHRRNGLITMVVLGFIATALVIATLFMIKPSAFIALISALSPEHGITLPHDETKGASGRNDAAAQDIRTGTIIRQPDDVAENADAILQQPVPSVPAQENVAAQTPVSKSPRVQEDSAASETTPPSPTLADEMAAASGVLSPTQTAPNIDAGEMATLPSDLASRDSVKTADDADAADEKKNWNHRLKRNPRTAS